MRVTKSFKLSFNILLHSKLRSWLTILGIIIGIAAVVAILSISEGAQQQLESSLGDLGADILTITPGFSRAMGPGSFGRGSGGPPGEESSTSTDTENLTSKDVLILKNLPNVEYVMGQISGREDLTYMTKTATVSITGVDTTVWKDITTEELSSGRFLTSGDSYSVVLGGEVVSSTFEDGIPLNSVVTIGDKSFKVVGILEEGREVYMSIGTARTILEDAEGDSFDSISVKLDDVTLSNDTITIITDKLMISHGIVDESKIDFTVSNPSSMQETIQSTMNTMTIFLGAIAAISLIVGAVGIANTMFTSVLEKTKEIGIMKAIGAKDKDIMIIFLLNAALIGLIGGTGGVLLGFFASTAISSMSGITTTTGGRGLLGMLGGTTYVSPELIIGALVFSILIGMIAGAIPAYRASKLNPVQALRYE
ncbi:MAG: ABC transporter permease [Candidatus Nanoarchaeia archaeon]|nr:ABC transporter permease [Candidatus Nanoarchaeia archaeon]